MTKGRLHFALLAALFGTAAGAGPAITVSDAWVREAPPGAPANAGYLTIHNADGVAHSLIGAASPQFARAELHATGTEGGRVRMRRVSVVEIPARGSLSFAPGQYHLMLAQPHRPLATGDRVELTLRFKDAPPVTVQAPVRSGEEDASADRHMQPDMDGM